MNSAAKYLAGIWLVAAVAANAQVTVWLENPANPEAGDVTLEVGQTATVQLWLEVPDGTILVNVDAILRGLDASFAKDLNFEVVGFNDVTIPDSQMQRVGRGNITEDLPNGFIDDYQFLADDANFPLDQNSGLTGPANVLLDEIIIQGIDENVADGPDQIIFASGAQLPGGFEMVFVEVPPPGSWSVAEVTAVELGTGGVDEPFLVNVEPAGGEPPNGGGGGGGGETNENSDDDEGNENAADDGEANDNEAPADSDNDGISDEEEEDAGTDPNDEDTDDDGIPDGVEVDNGLDPTVDDAGDDNDGDGLDNSEEIDAGTDPGNPDTDGDSENDDTDPDPNDPTVTSGAKSTGGRARGQTGGPCGVGLVGPLLFAVLVLRLGRGRR
jgi:hypothetical protein